MYKDQGPLSKWGTQSSFLGRKDLTSASPNTDLISSSQQWHELLGFTLHWRGHIAGSTAWLQSSTGGWELGFWQLVHSHFCLGVFWRFIFQQSPSCWAPRPETAPFLTSTREQMEGLWCLCLLEWMFLVSRLEFYLFRSWSDFFFSSN